MTKSFLLSLFLVFILSACTLTFPRVQIDFSPPTTPPSPTPEATPTSDQQLVGSDADEHGCIGSAGYTWCEAKNKCLRSWEEACAETGQEDNIEAAIKAALVAKHSWDPATIKVTVSKTVQGKYASGGINFIGAEAGGGYFFAAKTAGSWQIVADGNGTIECASLTPYPDFPTSMIPECYNSATGKSITR